MEFTVVTIENDDIFVKQCTGFTRTELTAAFELVQNPNDWKAPIDGYCTTDEVKTVAAAIEFFTATKPHFDYLRKVDADFLTALVANRTPKNHRLHFGDHIMKVRADGYRAGPAGDH